jgi:hypothetical protein
MVRLLRNSVILLMSKTIPLTDGSRLVQSVVQTFVPKVNANGLPASVQARTDRGLANELRYFTRRFKQCMGYCESVLAAYGTTVRVAQTGDEWTMIVRCHFKPIGLPVPNPVGRPPNLKV